jgi:hypothetical protein
VNHTKAGTIIVKLDDGSIHRFEPAWCMSVDPGFFSVWRDNLGGCVGPAVESWSVPHARVKSVHVVNVGHTAAVSVTYTPPVPERTE